MQKRQLLNARAIVINSRGVNSIPTLGGCQRLLPCETGNCPAKNKVYNITKSEKTALINVLVQYHFH